METHSLLPPQAKYTQDIPGMDGYVDFEIGGYGARIINTDIYFDGDYSKLRANEDDIIAWLANSAGAAKPLSFDNNSIKSYLAKIYSALDFVNTPDRKIGTIQFECNPPWAYLNGVPLTPAQIAWNNATNLGSEYIKDITADGAFKFTILGTHNVLPKITLTGNIPSGLQFAYTTGGTTYYWQYNAALQYDGILIDCTAQTVTRLSDGANLYPYVNSSKCAYFSLAAGQAEIDIIGTGGVWPLDFIMSVSFTPIS
jgi:phage-related protein